MLIQMDHCIVYAFRKSLSDQLRRNDGYNLVVAASLSGPGFLAYVLRQRNKENTVLTSLENQGSQYNGFYKCVRYDDPTRPIQGPPDLSFCMCSVEGCGVPHATLEAKKGLTFRPQPVTVVHK